MIVKNYSNMIVYKPNIKYDYLIELENGDQYVFKNLSNYEQLIEILIKEKSLEFIKNIHHITRLY